MIIKQLGSIYLILGTCIAGGMLGLPIVTAEFHFTLTTILLISSWIMMTIGAWCLLQVNMTMPKHANFISMAETSFGKIVKAITWVIYLLQLYSLVCMYLAGSGDLFQALLRDVHVTIPRWFSTVLVTTLLGSVVYGGIRAVDVSNRFLMSAKFIICFLLIASVIPYAHLSGLHAGDWNLNRNALFSVVTAFGYASILPSIRDYLNNDRKRIMRVFFVSCIIPPILYFVWVAVIQGALPRFGMDGLVSMNHSANTNSLLMNQIVSLTHHALIQSIGIVFISICAITGFLSVSTSLMDVITDGMRKQKHGRDRMLIALVAFVPPMLIVILDPAIFISALAFAGYCCVYMLVLLPVAMYWKQRRLRA